MDKEPAIIVGTITAIVSAVLVLLQSFGVGITDGQQNAIRGLVAVVAPLIAAFVIRGVVFSPKTHERAVNEARADGRDAGVQAERYRQVAPKPPLGTTR